MSEQNQRIMQRVVVHVWGCPECHGLAACPEGEEMAPCPCGGERKYIGATGFNRVVEVECVPVEVPHA